MKAFRIKSTTGTVNTFPYDGTITTRADAYKAATRALSAWLAAPIWGGRSLWIEDGVRS